MGEEAVPKRRWPNVPLRKPLLEAVSAGHRPPPMLEDVAVPLAV